MQNKKDIMKFAPTIENRKARHEYFVEETLECGMSLHGNEVKSIRDSKVSIKEAWISAENGELTVKQMHITPWKTTNLLRDTDTRRDIRLLAHKKEINYFQSKVQRDGYTLIPLKIYFNNNGVCKMLVGLCKGKHNYDKRASEKKRELSREINNIK